MQEHIALPNFSTVLQETTFLPFQCLFLWGRKHSIAPVQVPIRLHELLVLLCLGS
jgi:hypothetical protein